ncbi:MAG: c-type cytochrome [Methylococcales bacterium]|nr:c-type cytochrome [Methylococcales bacterium]
MKRMLLLLAFTTPIAVYAQPSTQVAWTPETLNLVKNGDLSKGKTLAETCKSCHGDQGQGMKEVAGDADNEAIPAVPAIAGQLPTYLYKQLRDYADGSRRHVAMTGVAQALDDQQAADVAAWFGSLPVPVSKAGSQSLAKAEKLVGDGDGKRILPPCFVCHDSNGKGAKQDVPALAGQQADYVARTLQDYKSGQRHNDVYSRMRLIAQQLSDEEIKQLAQYYQQLH